MVTLGLESTILDGVGRPDGEAGIKTSYSPVGAGTGAELGNNVALLVLDKAFHTETDY